MIDREHDLSITRQAEVLQISRGSVYHLPRPVPDADLAIMRRLDRLHLEFPFAGSRMLRGLLAAEGCKIGRRHVKTLMRRMGIEALYRRPRTTGPEPGHKIHPYLLRGTEITRPNQVWAMDITYIPMARGFVYLAVMLDLPIRRVPFVMWPIQFFFTIHIDKFCKEVPVAGAPCTGQDACAAHVNEPWSFRRVERRTSHESSSRMLRPNRIGEFKSGSCRRLHARLCRSCA
ncbi:hypothetical protein ABIC08_009267 [Bradyrhizobium sp. RT9b]